MSFGIVNELIDLRSVPSNKARIHNNHDRNRETQLLPGTCVHCVQTVKEWYEVDVPIQPVRSKPYRGWMPARGISQRDYCSCPQLTVFGTPEHAVEYALTYLGSSYLWGGMSEQGIDCSGLVYRAYFAIGFLLPRNACDQYAVTKQVNDLRVGDLVFMRDNTHVGIWTGTDMLEATDQGEGIVRRSSLDGVPYTIGRLNIPQTASPA